MGMKTEKRLIEETRMARTCRDLPLELRYCLFREAEADGGGAEYGVEVQAICQGERTCARAARLTVSREKAEAFLQMLLRGTVTPAGLMDVAEGWL